MTQYTTPDSIPLTDMTDIIASNTENIRLRMNALATATQQGLSAVRGAVGDGDAATLASSKAYTDLRDEAYRAVDRELWRLEDDGHQAAAERTGRAYTDAREALVRADFATSHIAIDTDGTPFVRLGSMTARVLQDTDGTPYYEAA